MLEVVIGHSDEVDPLDALSEVLESCRRQLSGRIPKAGILYTSIMDADHQAVLNKILEAFPDLQLIGCTTDGEISPLFDSIEQSLALLLFLSNTLDFAVGLGLNLSADPEGSLLQARDQAMTRLGRPPSLGILIPDGISTMSLPLGAVLADVFGHDLPLVGGSAGDCSRIVKTYQFCGDKAVTDSFALLLIAGRLHYGIGVENGWNLLGKRFTLGRVNGNRVYEIGGMPALTFYRKYLGENQEQFIPFPLAVHEKGQTCYYLRDPIYFHEEDGSIEFTGIFPEGAEVQLTEVGREEILDAAAKATETAVALYSGKKPDLYLIFSCAFRHWILGSRSCEECHTLKRLDSGTPYFGFYTYGEWAPFVQGSSVSFHNDCFVVLALGEE